MEEDDDDDDDVFVNLSKSEIRRVTIFLVCFLQRRCQSDAKSQPCLKISLRKENAYSVLW